METLLLLEWDPGRRQRLPQLALQTRQAGEVVTGDAGPKYLRAAEAGKRTDTMHRELQSVMLGNRPRDGRRKALDVWDRKMSQEVQRQMDTLDGIEPERIVQRTQIIDCWLQRASHRARQLDGDKDPPSFRLTARRGCQP